MNKKKIGKFIGLSLLSCVLPTSLVLACSSNPSDTKNGTSNNDSPPPEIQDKEYFLYNSDGEPTSTPISEGDILSKEHVEAWGVNFDSYEGLNINSYDSFIITKIDQSRGVVTLEVLDCFFSSLEGTHEEQICQIEVDGFKIVIRSFEEYENAWNLEEKTLDLNQLKTMNEFIEIVSSYLVTNLQTQTYVVDLLLSEESQDFQGYLENIKSQEIMFTYNNEVSINFISTQSIKETTESYLQSLQEPETPGSSASELILVDQTKILGGGSQIVKEDDLNYSLILKNDLIFSEEDIEGLLDEDVESLSEEYIESLFSLSATDDDNNATLSFEWETELEVSDAGKCVPGEYVLKIIASNEKGETLQELSLKIVVKDFLSEFVSVESVTQLLGKINVNDFVALLDLDAPTLNFFLDFVKELDSFFDTIKSDKMFQNWVNDANNWVYEEDLSNFKGDFLYEIIKGSQ